MCVYSSLEGIHSHDICAWGRERRERDRESARGPTCDCKACFEGAKISTPTAWAFNEGRERRERGREGERERESACTYSVLHAMQIIPQVLARVYQQVPSAQRPAMQSLRCHTHIAMIYLCGGESGEREGGKERERACMHSVLHAMRSIPRVLARVYQRAQPAVPHTYDISQSNSRQLHYTLSDAYPQCPSRPCCSLLRLAPSGQGLCSYMTVRTPDRAHNSFSIVIKSGQTRRAVVFTVHAHAALRPVVAARELPFNLI